MANVVFNRPSSWSRAVALVLLLIGGGNGCSEPPPPSPPPPLIHCDIPMGFFDLGSAELPQIRRKMLADAFRPGEVCAINPDPRRRLVFHVIGHTDGSGSENANEQLSLRRAQNVADYLVELGVAREYICVSSKGSKSLLVKTEGSEPQNRRVEIVASQLKPAQEPCQ